MFHIFFIELEGKNMTTFFAMGIFQKGSGKALEGNI